MSVTTALLRNCINAIGFKCRKKIVVLESDDWGAIRMPSKSVYDKLLSKGFISKDDPFLKYDTLETSNDLQALFEVLSSVKDSENNNAKLTANVIVANPNFLQIKESDFESYFFEPAAETFKNLQGSAKVIDDWKEGLNKNIFVPQLHGREHVNIGKWLWYLRKNDNSYREAFKNQTYALDGQVVAAFAYPDLNSSASLEAVLSDSVQMFKALFGYNTQSFIAPNYIWNHHVEEFLASQGINSLQGSKKQVANLLSSEGVKVIHRYHYLGQKNKFGQQYLVRNCLFEPSVNLSLDYVDICLRQIQNSFYWRKPAIICTHRLNFVGGLDIQRRDQNLQELRVLLQTIKRKWPDVIFLSTPELISYMSKT